MSLIWIIISTFAISLISFIGALTLFLKEKILDKILLSLVALAAGALMGGAFLHLIPESIDLGYNSFIYILVGFVLFFIVEKIFHWRHCHSKDCKIHSFAYMNLFGSAIHNFIDGLIISAGFITNINLGITTTIAIALHEIPQEIGDFGVLVHGGFDKIRALILNFFVALSVIFGGILGYFISSSIDTAFLLPFAAGGFIYIAASDLIPELRKTTELKKSLLTFITFSLGIGIMYGVKLLF